MPIYLLVPATDQNNTEPLHCSHYVSGAPSTVAKIKKIKCPHCSLKVNKESFATSEEASIPNIAQANTVEKQSSPEVSDDKRTLSSKLKIVVVVRSHH